jgi:hypothetical protein
MPFEYRVLPIRKGTCCTIHLVNDRREFHEPRLIGDIYCQRHTKLSKKNTNPSHGQIIFNIRYRIVIKILLIGARMEEKTELLFLALGLGRSSR